MKKAIIVLFGVGLAAGPIFPAQAAELSWEEIGRGRQEVRSVLINPEDGRVIYAGAAKAAAISRDRGENWRDYLLTKGEGRINFLAFGNRQGEIFAAASDGLYYRAQEAASWRRIFKGRNYLERDCLTVKVFSYAIFLGTRQGLFVSKDSGRTWQKAEGELGQGVILAIASCQKEEKVIFIAGSKGVFRSRDQGKSWEKIFVSREQESESGVEDDSAGSEVKTSQIRHIGVDPTESSRAYLATSNGVYLSQDQGSQWQAMTDYGLLSKDAEYLYISPDGRIFCLGPSGIFLFASGRWEELSLRLAGGKVYALAWDGQGYLYAGCAKGLFRAKLDTMVKDEPERRNNVYRQKIPDIADIQREAIKYAEVQPEKIKLWRKQAAAKAMLPHVSAGINRDTGDLWHWESGSSTRSGDDVLIRGKDSVGWDVTLTWDLSDLVFNDVQTSIDVRSKLMVELRDDILDEVTKLYFERVRVGMELEKLTFGDKKKEEKELRLKELAAMLDGLTGGYFSRNSGS